MEEKEIISLADELKTKITDWNKLTLEIVQKLYKAKLHYSNRGFRTDLLSFNSKLNSFKDFLEYIGLQEQKAYRWLNKFNPEENKLIETSGNNKNILPEGIIKIKPSEIIVNERVRKRTGDLGYLIEEIKNKGLYVPILISKDYILIDGYKRLIAWKMIYNDIPIECQVCNSNVDPKYMELITTFMLYIFDINVSILDNDKLFKAKEGIEDLLKSADEYIDTINSIDINDSEYKETYKEFRKIQIERLEKDKQMIKSRYNEILDRIEKEKIK